MTAFFVVLTVVSFLATPISCEYQVFLRDKEENRTWIYVYDYGNPNVFNYTISWCNSLGGSLPTIHSQQDLDFLGDVVIVKNSEGGDKTTWLNMKRMEGNSCKWLDNSPYDFRPTWYRPCDYTDSGGCDNSSCCGVIMWNDHDHKRISPLDCNHSSRKVCIIKTSDGEAPNKVVEILDISITSPPENLPYRTKIVKPSGYNLFLVGVGKWAGRVNRFMSMFNESTPRGLNTSSSENAEHHSQLLDEIVEEIDGIRRVLRYHNNSLVELHGNLTEDILSFDDDHREKLQALSDEINKNLTQVNQNELRDLSQLSLIKNDLMRVNQSTLELKKSLGVSSPSDRRDGHQYITIWIFLSLLTVTCIALVVTIVSILRRLPKEQQGALFSSDNENYDMEGICNNNYTVFRDTVE